MVIRRMFVTGLSYLMIGVGLLGICGALFLGGRLHSASAHLAASPSFVRVLHASPDVGTADVFVDGTKLLSSFAFGAVTDYASVPAGPHKVQIALVGKGIGASVLSETLTVNPGFAYTVAAVGTASTGLSLDVFVDNNQLNPGTAKLRVYQLSPDGGAISVTAAGKTLVSGISYQNASEYTVVSAGAYTFNVTSSSNNATLTADATLSANTVASLFVVGMYNGTPASEIVTSQATGLPGLPNTGSDPNSVSLMDAVQPLSPWSWPLGIASLLLIGSAVYLRRIVVKRKA